MMQEMLLGATAMAAMTVSLFFLRHWRDTRDRLFLFFAIAFALDGAGRVFLGIGSARQESEPLSYLIRLLSFSLIIAAIVDKNRR
ncbi:MAG TPA: DUF5985 family protein [Candidatus Eisenbacteria bacterium]